MARPILPLLALAAIIGLGILLIFGNDGDQPEPGKDLIDALQKNHGGQLEEVLEEVEMKQEQANRIERTDVEASAETTDPSAYQAPLPEGGILISVVQGEDDAPVPFADVLALDSGLVDMQEMRSFLAGSMDIEWVLRRFGKLYQADKSGQLRVPDPVGFLALAGITETLFEFVGNAEIEEGAYTLRLSPIDLLHVKVIDPAGAPVDGVMVTIRHHSRNRTINTIGQETNADGLAILKVFEGLKHELSDSGSTTVALTILSPTSIEKAIDLDALPKETVTLIMPATGKVTVNQRTTDGALSTEDFIVQLSIVDPDTDRDEALPLNEWGFDGMHMMSGSTDGSGTTTFDFVTLGQEVRVRASSMDHTKYATVSGPGPTTAGESVEFSVTPQVLSPVITGTLFGPDGKALVDQDIRVNFSDRDSHGLSFIGQRVETDAGGRFQAPFEGVVRLNDEYDCRISIHGKAGDKIMSALVALPTPLTVGFMELGDIHLAPTPTLLAGRVVDQFGKPIEHAQVMLEEDINFGDPDTPANWRSMVELFDRTDADGLFQIKGFANPGSYRVWTSHSDFESQRSDIILGTEDMEIVLQREIQIDGVVLVDSWLDPQELQVLVRTPNEYGGHSTSFLQLTTDGAFSIRPADDSTGLATITVTSRGGNLVLYAIEDLDLTAPESASILKTIDLRGLLNRITLTVRDDGGKFIDYVDVRSGSQGIGRGPGEMVQVVTLDASMDLEIAAKGYGMIRLDNASGHHDVVLPSGFSITITMDNMWVVAEGWRVQGQLAVVSKNEGGAVHHMIIDSDVPMDGSPVVVSRPGDYVVILTADEIKEGGRRYWGVPGDDPEFTVDNVTGTQDFTISIPAEAFDFLGTLTSDD